MTPDELRVFLEGVDEAMDAAQVPAAMRTEVMNRLLWGHPDGYQAVRRIDPDAKTVRLSWPQYEGASSHPIEPGQNALVFGGDARELLPAEERPLHPLSSTCRCGRAIVRLTGDEPWEHCD